MGSGDEGAGEREKEERVSGTKNESRVNRRVAKYIEKC